MRQRWGDDGEEGRKEEAKKPREKQGRESAVFLCADRRLRGGGAVMRMPWRGEEGQEAGGRRVDNKAGSKAKVK